MKGHDIIIIGAPRSGTNMLRDVLTALPGFATWPCDEINLTWRHGNRSHASDELGREKATPAVRRFLEREFDKLRRRTAAASVVEKTCANSLRVEFVSEVMPEARYILITRDGLDTAASAMARWNAPLDLRYTASKLRFTPPTDVPHYGTRFLGNQLRKRRVNGQDAGTAGWWGPKPRDWRELSRSRPLDEVCLIQWQRCVEGARRGLATIPDNQVFEVTYEAFVREPESGLRDLLDFLGNSARFDKAAVGSVSPSSIGKGRASLSDESRGRLMALGASTLESLGYVR